MKSHFLIKQLECLSLYSFGRVQTIYRTSCWHFDYRKQNETETIFFPIWTNQITHRIVTYRHSKIRNHDYFYPKGGHGLFKPNPIVLKLFLRCKKPVTICFIYRYVLTMLRCVVFIILIWREIVHEDIKI